MKKSFTRFASLFLFVSTISACEKAEIPSPETPEATQLRKTSGGGGGGGQTATTTYGGRATGIDATVWNFQSAIVTSNQTTIADTYFLPAAGGTVTRNELQTTIPNVLSAAASNASISGQNNGTVAQASVSTLQITSGGHTISAGQLQANASASCSIAPAGTSQVTNLLINGQLITVTGAANQTVFLPGGGMVIINEKSTVKKGATGITVTALHLIIPNVSDIRIASARADIKC